MKLLSMPLCCSSKVLCDFGGTSITEGADSRWKCKDLLKFFKGMTIRTKYLAHVVAFTNPDQKEAEKFLKEVGFKKKNVEEGNHGEKVAMWRISGQDLFQYWDSM